MTQMTKINKVVDSIDVQTRRTISKALSWFAIAGMVYLGGLVHKRSVAVTLAVVMVIVYVFGYSDGWRDSAVRGDN